MYVVFELIINELSFLTIHLTKPQLFLHVAKQQAEILEITLWRPHLFDANPLEILNSVWKSKSLAMFKSVFAYMYKSTLNRRAKSKKKITWIAILQWK